jgi:Transposase DDE domain group 1
MKAQAAKVGFHCEELFPRVGFIVTSLAASSRAVVGFYNKRGTAEQWIKEGKQAVAMTRPSCHRFRSNEVRPWLSVRHVTFKMGSFSARRPTSPFRTIPVTGAEPQPRERCAKGKCRKIFN